MCVRRNIRNYKIRIISNGLPGVLRSHLMSDCYILMDRLSITWSNPGSHDYDNPGFLRGNNLSFRSRSWSPISKIRAIGSPCRKHSLFVPRDTAIHLPHGCAIVPVTALRRGYLVNKMDMKKQIPNKNRTTQYVVHGWLIARPFTDRFLRNLASNIAFRLIFNILKKLLSWYYRHIMNLMESDLRDKLINK